MAKSNDKPKKETKKPKKEGKEKLVSAYKATLKEGKK